jgi:hypothetical protein
MERWLGTWVGALLLCVAAWIGWWLWRNWRASSAQPFARALRELRDVDESSPQAWYAVHRAFDGTAGRVVQPGALSVLFEHAPQFEPERSGIEQFFAQSAERFFAVHADAAAIGADPTVTVRGSPTATGGSRGAGTRASAASDESQVAGSRAVASTTTRSDVSIRALCAALRRIEKRHER